MLLLAKQTGKNPRALAQELAEAPGKGMSGYCKRGSCRAWFLQCDLQAGLLAGYCKRIEKAGPDFGHSSKGADSSVLVEYVSAKSHRCLPACGPRTGGGLRRQRVARILRSQGWKVGTEYYLNDAGLQMRTLGLSILLRARGALPVRKPTSPKIAIRVIIILLTLPVEITTLETQICLKSRKRKSQGSLPGIRHGGDFRGA